VNATRLENKGTNNKQAKGYQKNSSLLGNQTKRREKEGKDGCREEIEKEERKQEEAAGGGEVTGHARP
jgi:hypothetical protein